MYDIWRVAGSGGLDLKQKFKVLIDHDPRTSRRVFFQLADTRT